MYNKWKKIVRQSTRSLMIVVILVAGWLAYIVRATHSQREAVEAIRRAGGTVWYDWEWKNGRPVPNRRPGVPPWLVKSLGIDYFGNVVSVEFSEVGGMRYFLHLDAFRAGSERDGLIVGDSLLERLTCLGRIEHLSLDGTRTSDRSLDCLRKLRRLKSLSLNRTEITDAGLMKLVSLTDLQFLSVEYTQATTASARYLSKHIPGLLVVGAED